MNTESVKDQAALAGENPAELPSRRLVTIPNLLCFARIAGSFVLIGLALLEQPGWFVGVFVWLALTDWVDGKLAIWLNQRSVYGARLDSAADVALYTALTLGGLWLRWDVLRGELIWIGAAVGTYALSTSVALWRFGRFPSYHTRAAKTSWFLVLVGALLLLGGWAIWPFRVAMAGVALTNLEATLLGLLLPEWRADVTSLYHALRPPRASKNPSQPGADDGP
jgi:CDP-diacylglycerol--glycerol-3-phosphate 3-phosphatidyltransferase